MQFGIIFSLFLSKPLKRFLTKRCDIEHRQTEKKAAIHLFSSLTFGNRIFCGLIFFYTFGTDKSTKGSTNPACPSLMCLFHRGNTEAIKFWKSLCLMFVYVYFVLYEFVSGLIL